MAAIATATDGGGSIRIPAAYCGLAGLKPTNGVIARDPSVDRIDYTTGWIDYSTDGPLSSTVDDLRLLLDVMRGPRSGDPSALPSWVGPVERRLSIGRVRAVERWSDLGPLPAEVAEPFERAVAGFAEAFGVEVERLAPRDVFPEGSIDDDWFTVCAPEQAHRLGRAWIEEHLDELHPASREFLTFGLSVPIEDYLAARIRRFGFTRALDDLLGERGVILSPVMAADAIVAEGPGGATPAELYCTQAQNVTGHPAISLPAGLHASGVPFGLQVTGPRFRDDLLLAAAERWEAATPWPATAPGFEPFGGSV
jgi:Asp-tRNA(Asn)/Glu-tRNA(Gln) amidotransferase A subunit family amidase